MVSLYLDIMLSGNAPDAITLAALVRAYLEDISEGKDFYCEDVKVIPNWKLEVHEDDE